MKCVRCRTDMGRARPRAGRPRRYCSARCRVAAWRRRQGRTRAALFSSDSCEWATPQALFDRLNAEHGPFDLDACATPENAKCPRYFTREDDGLAQTWTGRVYVNAPYGRAIGDWLRKAWEASQGTADVVVCLVPARTDTSWWHAYAARGEVTFLPGRLRFGGAPSGAPFPSAVIEFRNAKSVTKFAPKVAS